MSTSGYSFSIKEITNIVQEEASKLYRKSIKVVYGNLNDDLKPLSKNFKNIQIKTKLFSKTREYTNKFLKLIIKKKTRYY